MKAELERRHGYTAHVLALFESRPLEWVHWHDLAEAGGELAWRTRVSNVRKQVRKTGGDIVWNKQTVGSAYMYRPFVALGRAAHEHVTQPRLL